MNKKMNKKSLYESIMKSVAKTVKHQLNESVISPNDIQLLTDFYQENPSYIFVIDNPVYSDNVQLDNEYNDEDLESLINTAKQDVLDLLSIDDIINELSVALKTAKSYNDNIKIKVQTKDSFQDNRLRINITSSGIDSYDIQDVTLYRKLNSKEYTKLINSDVYKNNADIKTSVSSRVKNMVINNVTKGLNTLIDNGITVDIEPSYIFNEDLIEDCAGYILESAVYSQVNKFKSSKLDLSSLRRRSSAEGHTDFNLGQFPIEVKSCKIEDFKLGNTTGNEYTTTQINELKNAPFGVLLVVGYSVTCNVINIDNVAVATTDDGLFRNNSNAVYIPRTSKLLF